MEPVLILTMLAAAGLCGHITFPESDNGMGVKSAIFAPGLISTNALEYAITFAPDCKSAYFSRRAGDWGGSVQHEAKIFETHWRGGEWSAPVTVSFTGDYGDDWPFISTDGRHMYFVSNRPKSPGGNKGDYDIWRSPRTDDGWGAPERLREPINSPGVEYSPVTVASGGIYFASTREDGVGQGDIYKALPKGDGSYDVALLPDVINSPTGEWNVFVNDDETILIFEASQRPQNLSPYGDLYISKRANSNAMWTDAVPARSINTAGSNLQPRVSPDGIYLFYGNTDTLKDRDANIRYAPLEQVLNDAFDRKSYLAVANRSEHTISLVDPNSFEIVEKIDSGIGPHEVAALSSNVIVTVSYGVYNDVANAMATPRRLRFKFDDSDGAVVYDVAQKSRNAIALANCVRPHGVESSADGSRFWVTCEEERAVIEVETHTGKELARWNTQQEGSHIVKYDESRDRLYVANVDAGSVTIIHRSNGESVVLKTDAGAEGLAFSNGGDRLWVTNTQANTISVIDLREKKVMRTFSSGGKFPVKIRITPDGKEAWIAHNNTSELTIFDVESMQIKQSISLDSAPLGLSISPEGARIFVSLPRLDRVDVIDAHKKRHITSFSPGIEPDGMAWVEIN